MKRILSIDGGGIRGIIPALVLAEIERQCGRPIAEIFDLVAGTSTGGILAMGLCKNGGNGKPEFSAEALAGLYAGRGSDIFGRTFWSRLRSGWGLMREQYAYQGLEAVLEDYFGDEPLGASLSRVLISSYDIHGREPFFIKSWREEFRRMQMRHAARATSAAPTYFQPALVPVDVGMRALVDGGVFINSPSVSAYAEARRLFPEEKEILLVSLGTGELVRPYAFANARRWGKVGWLVPLLNCVFDGVADAAHYQMKMILGDDYVRLQTSLSIASDEMDDASETNIENLKAEAAKLLRTHKAELEALCGRLAGQGRAEVA